jgi:hypothetical protein
MLPDTEIKFARRLLMPAHNAKFHWHSLSSFKDENAAETSPPVCNDSESLASLPTTELYLQ